MGFEDEALGDDLVELQFASVFRQIPAIHLTAQVNLAVCIFVLWYEGVDPRVYLWTPLLTLFALWRIFGWWRLRRQPGPPSLATMRKTLRGVTRASIISIAAVSAFSVSTFVLDEFDHSVVIPVALAFGSFAVAHCFAILTRTALATLLIGVMPTALAMLLFGGLQTQVLALSMISVVMLDIVFLFDHRRETMHRLRLGAAVRQSADRDWLTGLLNRRALFHRVEAAIEEGRPFVMAVLDLDGFKEINDNHGHLVGDAALRRVAETLNAMAKPNDCVARLGGDEFVMIMRDPPEAGEVTHRLSGLLQALESGANIAGIFVRTPCSLGFARFPDDGVTSDALYAAADGALYEAKRAGKGRSVRVQAGLQTVR